MPGLDQAMLNAMSGANFIKHMITGRYPLASGAEAVGKLLAVIGENFSNDEWSLLNQIFQKPLCGIGRFRGSDLHIDPPRCTVNSDKQILPAGFIGHLR